MARLSAETPFLHPGCKIVDSRFGAFVEIGEGSRILNSEFGDYSYTDQQADIANTDVGKFCNIAARTRIGPTDHPMDRASQHHMLYRSDDYWDDAPVWDEFFEQRAARRVVLGADCWIGAHAIIKPGVTIGTGAIVASGAVVTVNNHPAVDFNGTSHYMDKASVTLNPSSNAVLTFAGVFQFDSVSSGQYVAAQWDGTTSNQVFGLLNLSTASLRFMARFQNGTLSRVNSGSGTTAINTQYVGVGQFKANHSKGVLNDTDYTDTNVNSTVNHATSDFALGHRPDSGSGKFNGKLQEFCVWSQATNTHDRNALSDAIDGHYGTY